MIMQMKLGEILQLDAVIKSIIDSKNLAVSAVFKFRLLGILKSIETHVNNYEIVRVEKVKQYGKQTLDENGNMIDCKVEPNTENEKLFKQDIEEILNTDVVADIQKLKLKETFDSGLPTNYLLHLYPIMEQN